MLLGSVEAGGTKFVCAVGNEDYRILDITNFPTTTPEETLKKRRSITSNSLKISKQFQFHPLAQLSSGKTRRNLVYYRYTKGWLVQYGLCW